jgi:hypothetical protein
MSFDPAAVVRIAMEEEMHRLSTIRDEVDSTHPNAEPYKQKVNTQIADIQAQLDVMAKKSPVQLDTVESGDTVSNEKSKVRNKVWEELRKVALPDSRFHCTRYITFKAALWHANFCPRR